MTNERKQILRKRQAFRNLYRKLWQHLKTRYECNLEFGFNNSPAPIHFAGLCPFQCPQCAAIADAYATWSLMQHFLPNGHHAPFRAQSPQTIGVCYE